MISIFKRKGTIDEQIAEKSAELKQIHGFIEPSLRKKQHPLDVTYAVKELQAELEADIKKVELKLLTKKVKVYGKVLRILNP